jgi:mannose-6-phosphate isomerase-like protein (cupin superfamily)
MARVCKQSEANRLGLPGRTSLEIISGDAGAIGVTLRLVEIPVPAIAEPQRGPHHHNDTEECIFVLSGRATTFAESGEFQLEAGDTILMPAGEKHVTRNTGNEPLRLLCFFPVAEVAKSTEEGPSPKAPDAR